MSRLNVHWKGYPHHLLPRVRIPSRASSAGKQSLVQLTTEKTSRVPPDLAPKKQRKKRLRSRIFRCGKNGSSRSSASTRHARKRASQRAINSIEVFRCDTPNAGPASRVTTQTTLAHDSAKRDTAPRPTTASAALIEEAKKPTAIHSLDGTASSTFRHKTSQINNPHNPYFLAQVPETPGYGISRQPRVTTKPSFNLDRLIVQSGRHLEKQISLPNSTQADGQRTNVHHSKSSVRSRTYDRRLIPSTRVGKESRMKSRASLSRRYPSGHRNFATRVSTRSGIKSSAASPEFWRAVASLATPPGINGPSSSSIRSIVQSVLSSTSSRTLRQEKAIQRFSKELELYLQTTRQLPKQSLVSSASSTTLSANTIVEFKPYHADFKYADLAVTSAEQKRASNLANPSSLPSKDETWAKKSLQKKPEMMPGTKIKIIKQPKKKAPSFASGSTGTDIIGFTPPHEKRYARGVTYRAGSSSEGSVVGWTPQHERAASKAAVPSAATNDPRSSTKKSLPWLRHQSSPSYPEKRTIPTAATSPENYSTPLEDWTESFHIRSNPSSPKLKRRSEPSQSSHAGISHRTTEVKFEASNKNQAVNEVPEPRQLTACYTDSTTQTRLPESLANTAAVNPQIYFQKASHPISYSKAFSHDPTRHSEDSAAPVFPVYSARASNVSCEATNGKVKADVVETMNSTKKKTSVALGAQCIVQKGTPSYTVCPTRESAPPQLSPNLKKPDKNIDDHDLRMDPRNKICGEFDSVAEKKRIKIPTRRLPSVPVCKPYEYVATDPTSKLQEPQTQLDIMNHEDFVSTPRLYHNCKLQSCLKCQQCFPSVNLTPVSMINQPIPESVPIAGYHSDFQRFTQPIAPASPVPYAEKPARSLFSNRTQDDIVTRDHSPEEKAIRTQVVQDTIEDYAISTAVADPMKKLSVSGAKVRPLLTTQTFQGPFVPTATKRHWLPRSRPGPIHTHLKPPQTAVLSTSSADTYAQRPGEISDKHVFKGLHVATAAACDDDVDRWIEEVTGCGVRKFLGDLSAFDGLGVKTLASVAKRAAQQRRQQVRTWEKAREARMGDAAWVVNENWEDVAHEDRNAGDDKPGQHGDCRLGFTASDESMNLRHQWGKGKEKGREEMGRKRP